MKKKRLRWTGHTARMEGRGAFKILTGKPTGKRPLGRPRRRMEDNITMDIKETGVSTRNWIDLAHDGIIEEPSECGTDPPGSINHGVS